MKTDALSTLARRAKNGYARTKEGRSGWLAGTFELATALSQARKKLPSDQEFHAWIAKAGLASISKDDRAALIYIGDHQKAAREYFTSNEESWSWRLCAQQLRFAGFTVVSQVAKPQTINLPTHHVPGEPKQFQLRVRQATWNELLRSTWQLPPPVDLSTTRFAEAVQAVGAIIKASTLSIDSVARYCEERAARPSLDQLREAARWLDLLADTMERTCMTAGGHA